MSVNKPLQLEFLIIAVTEGYELFGMVYSQRVFTQQVRTIKI